MYYCDDNCTMVSGYNSVINNRLHTVANCLANVADVFNMPLLKYKAVLINYFKRAYFNEATA